MQLCRDKNSLLITLEKRQSVHFCIVKKTYFALLLIAPQRVPNNKKTDYEFYLQNFFYRFSGNIC